jgi:hypothetical protein
MNAQQRQKRARICQDAALLNQYSDGAALMEEEVKRVQRLQKNAQQRKRRRQDAALLNKYYADAVTVTDDEEKRVHRLDAARNKKYWMRYHRNMRDARDVEYYIWQKSFYRETAGFYCIYFKGRGC